MFILLWCFYDKEGLTNERVQIGFGIPGPGSAPQKGCRQRVTPPSVIAPQRQRWSSRDLFVPNSVTKQEEKGN
jgi:hypothetical protein